MFLLKYVYGTYKIPRGNEPQGRQSVPNKSACDRISMSKHCCIVAKKIPFKLSLAQKRFYFYLFKANSGI